jgi:hypothetical protein
VRALVVGDAAVGFLGGLDVAGAKDDAVGLRLLEKLLDGF